MGKMFKSSVTNTNQRCSGVMVIGMEIGIGKQSSNSGQGFLYLIHINVIWKGMNLSLLTSAHWHNG